ncbi:unnamed protein product [Pleuronectes platessa]|uniref:Uncharacterized protein n=1 Tax=Pleuronectes platessa TaxID=8262 RepID=A0A9N7VHB5_PLEPL|nr:unnamed protein product [Pleuronectes platessa]
MTHVEVLHAVLWRFPERFPERFSWCSLSEQLHRLGANPLLTRLFCFQEPTDPGEWSSAFPEIPGSRDQTPLLTGGPGRQAAATAAAAPGPEGNTLPVASLS